MSRGPHGRIALPKEDIIRQYNQGSSTPELGAKYGVSRVTILNRLREWEVEVRRTNSRQLGRHHSEETKLRISESLSGYQEHQWDIPEAETGNRGESNPGEDSAESNPGVSESPPARHLVEASTDPRRQRILELEAKIAATEVNLKQVHTLKYEHEQELAKLKGSSMMPGVR